MTRGKGGPSGYRADNQARRAPRGTKGAMAEKFSGGKRMPRTHEARAKRPARKRGFGKIHTTGQPRFTRHSQF